MKRFKRDLLNSLIFCLVLISSSVFGQIVFTNPITGTNPSTTNPYIIGQTFDLNVTVSGIGRGSGISAASATNRYAASGWNSGAVDLNDYFEFTLAPAVGYKIDFTSFVYTGQASGTGPTNFSFRTSIDGFVSNTGTPTVGGSTIILSGSQFQNITSAITFRLYGWAASSGAGTFSINEFTFNGTVTPAVVCTPPTTQATLFSSSNPTTNTLDINWTRGNGTNVLVIAKQGSAVNQAPVNGTTYAANTIFGSGANLTGGNFVVYNGIGSTATITGLLASTSYYFAAYEYNSASNCYTTSPLLGSGSTSCSAPITSATSLILGSTGSTTAAISWTNGSGTQRIVVAKEGSAVDFVPVNGTSYTANANFSQGTDLGSGNKVVYNGTSNSLTIQGLEQGKIYHFAVFEANCLGQQYKITSPARNSVNTVTTSGTILNPGDFVIIGYDNSIESGPNDKFIFAPLVDLAVGTSFSISNSTYELYAASNQRTRRWTSCTGTAPETGDIASIRFTLNTAVAKGSIICLELRSTLITNSLYVNNVALTNGTQFTSIGDGPNANTGVNISTTRPDAIFISQGNWILDGSNNFCTFDGRVLAGLQDGQKWYQAWESTVGVIDNNGRRSRIPPEIECYAIQGDTVARNYSSYFKTSSGLRTGSQIQIIRNVQDYINNWTSAAGNNTDNLPGGICNVPFTITGVATPGIWIGTGNTPSGRNWFDCRNWENLQVPDQTIDVLIGPKANNNCEVDALAPYSDNFNDTARCKGITISNRELILEGSPNDVIKIYGNLDINAISGLDMSDGIPNTPDGQMYLYGNWLNQQDEVEFKQGESTVHFVGGNTQTVTNLVSNNETFFNIKINKTDSNISLVGSNDITIDPLGNIQFDNGLIISNKINNSYVIFDNTATASNANINSFVDGPVVKNTSNTTSFDFPIGDVVTETNYFRPLGIQPTTSGNSTFESEYFFADYGDQTLGTGVSDVSTKEYWRLERTIGVANPIVKLSWDSSSDIPNELTTSHTDLLVSRFNGSNWETQGGTAHTGSVSKGTVFSSPEVNSFGPFTLAVNITPTPVDFIDFTISSSSNSYSTLRWSVIENMENHRYEIQTSKDGKLFNTIKTVIPKNNNQYTDYQETIINDGENYFRIKQVDLNGNSSYSKILYSNIIRPSTIQLIPNPAISQVSLIGLNPESIYTLTMYSLFGEILLQAEGDQNSLNQVLITQFQSLPKGMTLVKIANESSINNIKLLIN